MTELATLVSTLDTLLDSERFEDYCPNGLQIEGRPRVRYVVSGVSRPHPSWPGGDPGLKAQAGSVPMKSLPPCQARAREPPHRRRKPHCEHLPPRRSELRSNVKTSDLR